MRRDSIFYALFQQSPMLLFELLEDPPPDADQYRFDSVAVKEPKFEIDGVFLPPDTETPGVVYFCEVQFQRDERLYERLFGELFLYFYRSRERFSDWQSVIIYPHQITEQSQIEPYRILLESHKVHRVFLDELGDIRQLPMGVALMVLTILEEDKASEVARSLLIRSQREISEPIASQAIIEMLITIMVYKFTKLTRQEIERMLGISLQQTRVYQEAKAEGEQQGRQEEARSLILRLLTRRVGELSQQVQSQVEALSIIQLETLGEALLDFRELTDLDDWLQENQ
ncbi:Rpn family recombination-promoting nuclease/putative transposase [Kovacikia minuta CCNUW1]|uniref:Rpn family recombination-promoting nuclease/putative transposase n=1 Tax=Kovacikia minuta TaxID=2931930 RepID=UPI001CCFA71A|nr:Rpn family recombination-promoting nuclease/putative transposase [Kovacikia minuta]UBF26517.1 Rpn family recombination-promoting nuclease/putative transposase [Kovacikia minuta CCNUW1]